MLFASDAAGSIGLIFLVLPGAGAYLIPTIVAVVRKVVNVGSVAVINIFLGWTFVGWVAALAMATRSNPASSTVNVQTVVGSSSGAPSATQPGAGQSQQAAYEPAPQHTYRSGELGEGRRGSVSVSGRTLSSTPKCPGCQSTTAPGQAFCGSCGTRVATA